MILEILLSIPTFIFIWFFIFKVKLKYDKKKLLKDLPKKLEKQEENFYNDGKESDFKNRILGAEREKKEEVIKALEKKKNKPSIIAKLKLKKVKKK